MLSVNTSWISQNDWMLKTQTWKFCICCSLIISNGRLSSVRTLFYHVFLLFVLVCYRSVSLCSLSHIFLFFLVADRGLWFEFFVLVFGGYSLVRKVNSLIRNAPDFDDHGYPEVLLPPASYDDELGDQLNFWCSSTLLVLKNCSPQSVSRPLFIHTLFLESRGLSKRGRNLLAKQGLCQNDTTYRRLKAQELVCAEDVLRFDTIRITMLELSLACLM